jgi:hypothetical protein
LKLSDELTKKDKVIRNQMKYLFNKYKNKTLRDYSNPTVVTDISSGSWCKLRIMVGYSDLIYATYKMKVNELIITEFSEKYTPKNLDLHYELIIDPEAFKELIYGFFNFTDLEYIIYELYNEKGTSQFKFNRSDYKNKIKKLVMEIKMKGEY